MERFPFFHPIIARWFGERVGTPTDAQARAWPLIAEGKHVLATAPTGSGKTLAAFLWALNQLITGAWATGATRVLYVSPLKALNNDIRRNLLEPLNELEGLFREAGAFWPTIRVMTRSGDTPSSERQKMVRRPPEILITTPESLNLMLSAPRARETLRGIETVILDEIHAVAAGKRGVHLMTAVERVALMSGEFQRIALSATIRPLEVIADFAGGYAADWDGDDPVYRKRPVSILESAGGKRYDVTVRFPAPRASHPEDGSRWPALAKAIKGIIRRNRSTLVFTNARRQCERISLHLNRDEAELTAYAHHGSLSREMREVVEQRLKDGALKAIVATSSLELGIDIGALDEVVLVETPFSVASTVQRLGRAGHRVGEVSRGVLFPIHGHDILEAAVMTRAVADGAIEPAKPICNALDVLAQVIVSMTTVETWNVDRLYGALRCSHAYHHLPRRHFDLVVDMLAGRYADSRVRALAPLVSVDAIDGTIRAKPGAPRILYGSGGTIPDRGYFNLRLQSSKAKIGELDEEFVWERHLGETFTLGTQAWKIQEITHNDVLVTPGTVKPQDVPFWKGEEVGRGHAFLARVGAFLEEANGALRTGAFRQRLLDDHHLDENAADALIEYLRRQKEASRADLPHRHHVLIERCTDHRRGSEQTQIILHTLWGGAINRPFALALGQAAERRFGGRVKVFANNGAVVLAPPPEWPGEEADPFLLVPPEEIEGLLRETLEQTGFFGARFRENAARALLLPKQAFGKRMPLWMNRLRSKRLLDAVAPCEDFPILIETWRQCLQDEFDLEGLQTVLNEIRAGIIQTTEARTSLPTPFAAALVWGETNQYMYAGDTPDSAVKSNLGDDVLKEAVFAADLRPEIPLGLAAEFQAKAQRTFEDYAPGSPEEVLDWVKERLYISGDEWTALLEAVERDHGLGPAAVRKALTEKLVHMESPRRGVLAREGVARFLTAFGLRAEDVTWERDTGVTPAAGSSNGETDPLAEWLSEWLRFYGPVAIGELADRLPVDSNRLDGVLETLTGANAVVTGHLRESATALEVCDSENLEILLRLLRKRGRVETVALPLAKLPLFMAAQQGLARTEDDPGGIHGALETLFSYPMAAEALERDVLPARVAGYKPSMLDTVMTESDLVWIGTGPRRIAVGLTTNLDLFMNPRDETSPDEQRWAAIAPKLLPSPIGRYTFAELLDHTQITSGELTESLWEFAWDRRLSNDSFQALRKGVETHFKASELTAPAGRTLRRAGFRAWKATRAYLGNWFQLPSPAPPGDLVDEAELIKDRARAVLGRYGVVFRQLLQQELPELRWTAIFKALRLMELSGEIFAGHFLEDVPGLQFASAEALARLQHPLPEDTVFWMNAADPASLCGVDVAGLKAMLPKRLKTTHLVFRGARLVVAAYRSGKDLTIDPPPDDPLLPRCLGVFHHLLTRPIHPLRSVTVETINGESAPRSPYLDVFRQQFDVTADPRRISLYPAAALVR